MFRPEYRTTGHLIKLLENIAAATALIRNTRLQVSIKAPLERDAFARSVHSSTWIEGNLLSLAEVRAVAQGQEILAEEKQKREVANCLDAMQWVLKHKDNAVQEKGLLTLHTKMINGLLDKERSGRYRRIQNYIVDARNRVIFTPPPPKQVDKRMKVLFAWSKDKTIHPIIRSAIFHHEFLTIHPFTDGNGRVARAVGQWLLWEKNFDPLCTLALDDFFAQNRPRYYNMIQETREMDGDYTHWVEYIAEGLARSVEIVQERVKDGSLKLQGVSLTPRQEELVALFGKEGVLNSAKISQIMKINRARVNQLIAPLVRLGIVLKEGAARGVRYRLTEK